ncbi:unnamed protein product [Arabis nemorensis]|uniref:Uncharacterized protein n=1 Tax=Arabis nemorensis TaxID=586526 RepID=A0A565BHX6_9BRAS|nr:unnamed protein product [Arabis nemorensis]
MKTMFDSTPNQPLPLIQQEPSDLSPHPPLIQQEPSDLSPHPPLNNRCRAWLQRNESNRLILHRFVTRSDYTIGITVRFNAVWRNSDDGWIRIWRVVSY